MKTRILALAAVAALTSCAGFSGLSLVTHPDGSISVGGTITPTPVKGTVTEVRDEK